jgi:hypothetical protein
MVEKPRIEIPDEKGNTPLDAIQVTDFLGEKTTAKGAFGPIEAARTAPNIPSFAVDSYENGFEFLCQVYNVKVRSLSLLYAGNPDLTIDPLISRSRKNAHGIFPRSGRPL